MVKAIREFDIYFIQLCNLDNMATASFSQSQYRLLQFVQQINYNLTQNRIVFHNSVKFDVAISLVIAFIFFILRLAFNTKTPQSQNTVMLRQLLIKTIVYIVTVVVQGTMLTNLRIQAIQIMLTPHTLCNIIHMLRH